MEKCNRTKKSIRIVAAILTIIWMAVIYSFSAEDEEESGDASRTVSYQIVVSADNFLGLNWDDEHVLAVATAIEGGVRKVAHMIEYGILAILFGIAIDIWSVDSKQMWLRLVGDLIVCAVYAATDEYHQTFVVGRNGSVGDVGVDAVGSLLVLVLITLIVSARRKRLE